MANYRDIRTNYNYPNISPVPQVINNTPTITPNINHGPSQSDYFVNLGIPQISSNVYNGVNAFNSSCGNFSPLPGNNPSIVNNSSHDVNNIYHNSPQQQRQIKVYEVPGFPGYKVELVFTPIDYQNNQQSAQSMNTTQMGPDGQIFSSQSEVPTGCNQRSSLNNYGITNNHISPYMHDNGQQSSAFTSMQNYQNYYNPLQQQEQTNFFEVLGYENPGNNPQNSANNFYGRT
jgi:hypothetical protein